MSKAFAFAGGRLGYLAAGPALVDALRLVRLPYHLSSPDPGDRPGGAARTPPRCSRRSRSSRSSATASSPSSPRLGLDPVPSDANFVLFGGLADAHGDWQALLDRGVLVRDVGIPHYLRVTAGTPAGDRRRFLEAIADLVRPTAQERSA